MTQELIKVGAHPNDGTGDPIRDAYTKCNENFTELYSRLTSAVQLWTPGLTFGNASDGMTFVARRGFYVASGPVVYVNGFIQLLAKGTSTGVARITNFPFGVLVGAGAPLAGFINGSLSPANVIPVVISGGNFAFLNIFAGGNIGAISDALFTDHTVVQFNGSYLRA